MAGFAWREKEDRGHDLEFIALDCGETGIRELVTVRGKLRLGS